MIERIKKFELLFELMLLEEIKSEVENDLKNRLNELEVELEAGVEINSLNQDQKAFLAAPLGFKLASKLNKSPEDSLNQFLEGFNTEIKYIDRIEVESGYLNIFINERQFSKQILDQLDQQGQYAKLEMDNGLAVIDESSPNIAKPMHVGHLRNTLISDSLNQVLERTGYEVIADNHLGDWGSQFGNLMYAFEQWGSQQKLEEQPIEHLLDLYQRFGQKEKELEGEELEEFREKGRNWFRKLEDGEKEAENLWNKFRESSIERFKETYSILDIEFDEWLGESFYVRNGWTDKIVEKALDQDIAKQKEDGSIVIEVGEPNPETGEREELVIQKSDGTTLYSTRDLATILYRKERWDPEHMMYVVASEQDKYFEEIFEVAERLGFKDTQFSHISYGMISLPEGSMSTREGNMITARQVIEEAAEKAYDIVEENNPELSEEEMQKLSDKIGLGAVRFEVLKYSRRKDMEFDKDQALDFKGQTGPYLLYSVTRAEKILEQSDLEEDNDIKIEELSEEEIELISLISKFSMKLKEAESRYDPSVIANYGHELAQAFNGFYHNCPVLESDEGLKKQRLALVNAYIRTMEEVLEILRIEKVRLM